MTDTLKAKDCELLESGPGIDVIESERYGFCKYGLVDAKESSLYWWTGIVWPFPSSGTSDVLTSLAPIPVYVNRARVNKDKAVKLVSDYKREVIKSMKRSHRLLGFLSTEVAAAFRYTSL